MKILGIAVVTLRRWANQHNVSSIRTLGGHRRFSHDVLFPSTHDGFTLLYARVSSRDQKEDLQRHLYVVKTRYLDYEQPPSSLREDIGSGLNTRKPGLKKLVALVLAKKVKRLVLTHKDRLLRFANDLLLDICRTFGEFRRQLEYKMEARGGELIIADRYYPSSKKCSHCKDVFKGLLRSQTTWTCAVCKTEHDRDVNAAHNLWNVTT